ncbi:hypothetical protein [Nocardioides sp.]|uniref:LysM peptidoglycan-binding domain-containing protein n=1 Tax=Nocardioides sp. TaxID=35761 RepID=UPI002F42E874
MLLGDRGSRWRCLFVWVSGTSTLTALVLFLLLEPSPARDGRGSLDTVALDRALVDLASVALLACAAWAWVVLTATVVEGWRGVCPVRRRPWHAPAGVRRALLAACGVALTTTVAAPALATDHERSHHHHQYKRHGAALLDGLPLPQRTVAPTGSPVSRVRVRTVLVRPGDCLWSIAARDLGAGASDSAVDARWRAIYAANHALVGPDPGLVEPGQRLHLPEAGLSGKDAS